MSRDRAVRVSGIRSMLSLRSRQCLRSSTDDRRARSAAYERVTWHYLADHERAEPVRRDTRLDDSARKSAGIEPRPFTETVADALRWLVESRRIPPRRPP